MSEYSSSTIICASSNLANDIRLTHKKQSQERIYKHQKVISLNQWLEEQYQTWCFNHPDSHYHRILNGIEEKFFWEKSIGKFIEKQVSDDFFGIDIEKDIAEFCIRANHAFTEFMVTDAEITKQKHYREIKLFNQIRDDFNAELKRQRLISKDALIKEVIKIQNAGQPIKNERLIFIGFEFDKPIYKELIQLLGKCNHIERCIQNEDSANINYHQFNNVEDELNHISQWVKKLIDGGAKKILIITPALAEFQSTLENKILRLAQTEIFHDPRLESITTSTLRRPLTNEPSIRFITQLLRMPLKNIIATNEWFEILTFTNWINQENFHQRQKIGEIIKESKRKGFSIEGLMMFIKNHDDLEYQSTIQQLSSIDHFKTNIHKKQSPYLFNKLVLDLIDEIKWMKIYKLLPFEINILNSFYNVLNQISKFPIDEKISYQRYIEVLDYYLEKVMTSEDKPDAKITLSGFMEEQYLNYDAVWVANFNDTFWPEKKAFNPFLPKTIIEDHCIYDESYFRQLTQYRINQAKTITSNFNLSCSHYYDDVPMMPSLNIMNFDKAIELINQEPYELMSYQDFLDDSESIAMTGDLIHIKSGIKTLENHARCPAWSFYANRLGAEPPMTDLFDEVSQLDLGRLIHKTLELFWKKNTELGNLKKLGVSKLKEDLEKIIDPLLTQLINERPLLSSNQINSCKNYLMKRSLKWLEYEKNRESFEVILQEKNYEVTIKNIAFKIRIDRIDQLEDDTKIIIDYKTGAIPSRSELFNDRLTFLQLPIYGGYTQEQNIKGVMVAHLNIHKNSFYGVTDDAVKISPDFKGVINTPSISNWKDLIKQWRHLLETISLSYQRGDCQVTFYKEHDLNFCPVLPIMRLPEKKYQYESKY
ncbi:MAG: PD-(D/E)XK nuclease family protein [Methylophilaceae bacterium]